MAVTIIRNTAFDLVATCDANPNDHLHIVTNGDEATFEIKIMGTGEGDVVFITKKDARKIGEALIAWANDSTGEAF